MFSLISDLKEKLNLSTEDIKKQDEETESIPDCSTCPLPCYNESQKGETDTRINDLTIPEKIYDQVEWSTSMNGSVKPYQHHIFIQLGSSKVWPDKTEKLEVVKEVSEIVDKANFKGKALVTCIESYEDFESSNDIVNPVDLKIMVFPNAIEVLIDRDSIEEFINNVANNKPLEPIGTFIPRQIQGKCSVFICTHKKRDIRCGTIGPLLLEAFNRKIQDLNVFNDVNIYGASHYSGHKFAGNCIIYHRNPTLNGIWYAKVTPKNVEDIITKTIINEKILHNLYRGRIDAPINTKSFVNW